MEPIDVPDEVVDDGLEVQLEHPRGVMPVVDVFKQSRLQAVAFLEMNGVRSGQGGGSVIPCCIATHDEVPCVISCWRMTLWQRITLLLTGKLWMATRGVMHPSSTLFVSDPFEAVKK